MNRLFPLKLLIPILILAVLCCITGKLFSQEYRRWQMNEDGSISWIINNNIPHDDHIEMSGKKSPAFSGMAYMQIVLFMRPAALCGQC